MTFRTVKFAAEAEHQNLGRNGFSQAHGIQANVINGCSVFLEPLNSKSEATRARIVVPLAHAADVARALMEVSGEEPFAGMGAPPELLKAARKVREEIRAHWTRDELAADHCGMEVALDALERALGVAPGGEG